MKTVSKILKIIALILSHIMCIVISYNYRDMLCGIEHKGYSAPANIVFLTAIPYLFLITLCLIISKILKNKK